MKIDGKVALVVGGAQGIGRAYCDALLTRGAKVVIGDILEEVGRKTASEFCATYGQGKAVFFVCDIRLESHVKDIFQNTVKMYGIPDIYVHNAGMADEYNWEKCLSINVTGMMRCCTEAFKYMGKPNGGNGGVIVTTASIAGLGPVKWGPVYAATKSANIGYAISWGLPINVAVTGVRFNCVCPTKVNTDFLKSIIPGKVYHAEMHQHNIEKASLLTPEEVAEALIRLIEDDSLTGKALKVTKTYGQRFAEFEDVSVQ